MGSAYKGGNKMISKILIGLAIALTVLFLTMIVIAQLSYR